ncbi:MAG: hypothetical protein KAK00_08110 [Nanoarchaeota archaeon]|nr:hypothetical protein [Nanoarchaeota archaeon]
MERNIRRRIVNKFYTLIALTLFFNISTKFRYVHGFDFIVDILKIIKNGI